MSGAIWHDYPKDGTPTTCCGRTADELPLGDGRTTAVERVTCDGTFTPALFAHEVYAHPSEYGDQPQTLEHAVRYHLARALAMYPPEFNGGDRAWMDRINLMIAERTIACHVIALEKGLAGQAALDWAHEWSSGDDGELMFDLAHEYGLPLERIRPYAMRNEPTAEAAR